MAVGTPELCGADQTQKCQEKAVQIAPSSSGRRQFGWPSSAGAREDSPDGCHRQGLWSFADLIRLSSSESGSPHRDFPTVVQEFCSPVKGSPCRSLFVSSPNLATSRPGHRVFVCLRLALEVLGNESHRKMSAFGSGFLHESANFIHVYPLKKPNFCSVWKAPSPGGFLLSILGLFF